MVFLKLLRDSILLIILFCILCVVEHSILAGGVELQTVIREELKSDENPNCLSIVFNSESGSAGEMQICLPSNGENDTDASEDSPCFSGEDLIAHPVKGVIVWGNKVSEFVVDAQKTLSKQESKMDEEENNTPKIENEITYDKFKFDEYLKVNFYLHRLENWLGYGTKYLLRVSSAIGKEDVLTTSLIDPNLLEGNVDYDLRAEFKPTVKEKYHLPILHSFMEDNVILGFKKLNKQSPEPVYLLMCRLGYDNYDINDVETTAQQRVVKSVYH